MLSVEIWDHMPDGAFAPSGTIFGTRLLLANDRPGGCAVQHYRQPLGSLDPEQRPSNERPTICLNRDASAFSAWPCAGRHIRRTARSSGNARMRSAPIAAGSRLSIHGDDAVSLDGDLFLLLYSSGPARTGNSRNRSRTSGERATYATTARFSRAEISTESSTALVRGRPDVTRVRASKTR